MNILVTGSTGFVGSALCRALIEKGHQVRAFHRPSSILKLLEGVPVEHFEGNLGQPETVRAAMQGMEAVFHCAAYSGRREDPGAMYTLVVESTRLVCKTAQEAGVKRLVYTSSAASLGVPEEIPLPDCPPVLLDENHAWNYRPQFWYFGYTKYLAELEVQKAVAAGLDAVIVNPALCFGAGDIYRRSSSLVVQVAHNKLPGVVPGGLNVIHVQDVVAGHIAALERGRRGERYILGGENLTIPDLVNLTAEITGAAAPRLVIPVGWARLLNTPVRILQPFLSLPFSGNLLRLAGRYFYYDSRKAQVNLGLPAPRPARQAIQDAYEWFLQNGAIPRPAAPEKPKT